MTRRRCSRCTGEDGAFIVLWTLLVIAVLIMAALAIDLGQARAERRTDQSVADFSALASSNQLSFSPAGACIDAWAYIQNNAPNLPANASMPCSDNQSGFPAGCPNTPKDVVATNSGPYTITFRYPVVDNDIRDPRFTNNGIGLNDGSACQRFKVTVSRTRAGFFGGVVGQLSQTTSASAVMRLTPGQTKNVPSLWLLDPTDCVALSATGSSHVIVGQIDDPATPAVEPTIPGLITVDSNGHSCGSKKTVTIGGSGTQVLAVPTTGSPSGSVSLYSLPAGTDCNTAPNACNQSDVNNGSLAPPPVSRSVRATRAPLDWAYDCKANATDTAYPIYHSAQEGGVKIDDCPAASTTPPYITNLRTYVGASGQPSGFQQWTTSSLVTSNGVNPLPAGNSRCNPSGTVIALPANWWIDCPGASGSGGLRASGSGGSAGQITIQGGNVVLDGQISISGNGFLSINGDLNGANSYAVANNLNSSCAGSFDPTTGDVLVPPAFCPTQYSKNAAFVYMRNGDLSMNGGNLGLNNTFLYQDNGAIKITAGAPPRWLAPTEGAFNKLSLWSEKSTDFSLNGGANLALRGVFFAPEANAFSLQGNGNFPSLKAQFIAYHLDISGGGTLTLVPDPTVNIKAPDVGGSLIR